MDFIVDNYVWFIVGGVIILMAIIGYIADKTDFGRKNKEEQNSEKKVKEKKVKEKKVDEKKEKIKVEAKGINELTQKAAKDSQIPLENDVNKDNASVPISSNENIDQSLFAPLSDKTTEEIVQTNGINDNFELKNVEPTKLESQNSEKSQPVMEDEDIWKF